MEGYGKIMADLKEAMKSGDQGRRDTLRLVTSALKNHAIEKRVAPEALPAEEVDAVLRRMVKQRRESIEQYRSAGRADLAEAEEAELAILTGYLPEPLSETELEALVDEALSEGGFADKSQLGPAMGAVMKKAGGRASGEAVRALLQAKLG